MPSICADGTCKSYNYTLIITAPTWQCLEPTTPSGPPTFVPGSGGALLWQGVQQGPTSDRFAYSDSLANTSEYLSTWWAEAGDGNFAFGQAVCQPYVSTVSVTVSSDQGKRNLAYEVLERGSLLALPSTTAPDLGNNNMWAVSEAVAQRMQGTLLLRDPASVRFR